jgi:hypothetical protein
LERSIVKSRNAKGNRGAHQHMCSAESGSATG